MSDESVQGLKRERDMNPDNFMAFRRWRRAHHRAGGEGPDLAAEAKRLAIRWFVLSVRHARIRGLIAGDRVERLRGQKLQLVVEEQRDLALRQFWRAYRSAGSYMQPASMLDKLCLDAVEPQFERAFDNMDFVRKTDGAWAILAALKVAPSYIARRNYARGQREREVRFRRQTDGDRAMLDSITERDLEAFAGRPRTNEPDQAHQHFADDAVRTRAALAGYTELPRSHQYGCDVCGAPSTFHRQEDPGRTLFRCATHAIDTQHAILAGHTPMPMPHAQACPACGGTGMGDYPFACNVCGGPPPAR